MCLSKAQILKTELETRLSYFIELLSCSQKVQPLSVSSIDYQTEMFGLPNHFGELIVRANELAREYKKEKLVAYYFGELLIQARLHQTRILELHASMAQKPREQHDPGDLDRHFYMLTLYTQYERFQRKLGYLQSTHFIPVLKPLWHHDGQTHVPMEVILRKQLENEIFPKKFSLIHVLELNRGPLLKTETTGRVHEIFAWLIGWSKRMVAGNLNRMAPGSKEDPDQFPAHKFNGYWQKRLDEGGPIE